jgi:hypothetical protein
VCNAVPVERPGTKQFNHWKLEIAVCLTESVCSTNQLLLSGVCGQNVERFEQPLIGNGPATTPFARQWLCNRQVMAAIDMDATIEELLLEALFSVRFVPGLYSEDQLPFTPPCGGGVECLHRDPASRRLRKGKSQI